MSAEARSRVQALVIVGEAVVIFVLATMLLLDFGEVDLQDYQPVPAGGSGDVAPGEAPVVAADAHGSRPRAAGTGGRREQGRESVPARVSIQPEDRYRPEDPIGLVLYGVVFDPEGKPVKSAYVRLTSLETGHGLNAMFYRDSGYAAAGLEPGPWRILVRTSGHQPLRRTIELTPSPARVRLDLHVRSATTVAVAVRTPDGKPLQAEMRSKDLKRVYTLVQAFGEDPGSRFPKGLAGLNMSYNDRSRWSSRKTRPDSDGSLEVLIDPPCFVALLAGEAVLDCKPLAGGEDLLTLTASLEKVRAVLGTVLVKLTTSDGAPLSNVRVRVDRAYARKPAVAGGGVYRLEHVRPGLHRLSVTANGRGTVYRQVRVESGKELSVEVMLEPEARLEGQVLGPEGPLGSVSVRLYPLDPRVPETRQFGSGTNKEGKFKASRVPPGSYQLVACHTASQLCAVSTVHVQPGTNTLAPITLSGAGKLVIEASGLPLGARRRIRIHDRRGRVLYRASISHYGRRVLLPAGSHRYQVLDGNEQALQRGTVVVGDEPAVLHAR